jgi:hypothetical protein
LNSWYFTALSIAQCLRLLDPDTAAVLTAFGAMRGGGGWIGPEALPDVRTVRDLWDLVGGAEGIGVIDFACVLDGVLVVSSHDDGEVLVRAAAPFDLRPVARAVLGSRGFDPEAILDVAEANPGAYLAIVRPGRVSGIHADFAAYVRATR